MHGVPLAIAAFPFLPDLLHHILQNTFDLFRFFFFFFFLFFSFFCFLVFVFFVFSFFMVWFVLWYYRTRYASTSLALP